ncbi:leukemia inhibitory factor receptor-like [Pelobates fuscus]|uniref:leukemia inhibitory factor receptor-like n=1 Tax=Pelobates fuscus TaxID=191477 RepID=UPI002FE4E817
MRTALHYYVTLLPSLQYEQSDEVSYVLNITRLPDSCQNSPQLYELMDSQFHINLSLAFYEITVYAKNKAGPSPSSSTLVPLLSAPELEGKLFATVQDGNILLTWSPRFQCDFFIVNWGTNSSKMETKTFMEKMENVTLTGDFENMKKYTIMIHLYPEYCECDEFTNENTFGITYNYAEESVPIAAPGSIVIKNITKESAHISWEEIQEENCLGFLVGYVIHYKDILQNTTLY